MDHTSSTLASASMISSDKMIVTGGQFSQTFNDNRQYHLQGSRSGKAPFDVLKEAAAPSAFHNAGLRFDSPKCHPHTRVAVLQKIMDWILGEDDETRSSLIMWLTGAAGSGKSSIAESIIERLLAEPDTLMPASFFFGKSDATRNHSEPLIATLAYQVYRAIPAIQAQVNSAIDDDPLIFSKTLDYQLITLILRPLQNLHASNQFGQSKSRYLIVIDGLDECISRSSQRFILKTLSAGVRQFQLPIAFLVASRPEQDISDVFTSRSMNDIHVRLILDDKYKPDDDIRTFLTENLQRIRDEHPFRRMIPDGWPGYRIISEIVSKSSGQFIYAATILKFIESVRHRPDHRLDIIRKLRPAKGDLPFEELDALYRHILSDLDRESVEKVLRTLSFVFLWTALRKIPSVDRIEHFLSFDQGEVSLLFCDLGSLVELKGPEDYGTFTILHASLQDFLMDRARSKVFYVDIESAKAQLIVTCLRHLSSITDTRNDMEDIVDLFVVLSRNCDISPDLVNEIAAFPIRHICFSDSFVGSWTRRSLRPIFLPAFFDLMEHILDQDPTRSYILDRQSQILDSIFKSHMDYYYSRGSLSLLIALVFHAGSHYFVPLLRISFQDVLPCPGDTLENHIQNLRFHDQLSIFESFRRPQNGYISIFKKFMVSETRSGRYTLGGDIYARAALYCIQFLEDKAWVDRLALVAHRWGDNLLANTDPVDMCEEDNAEYDQARDDKCDLATSLYFKDERWTWKSGSLNVHNWTDHDVDLYSLVLGYLIYFLPMSGMYDPLIQHCKRHTLSSGSPATYFPIRTRFADRRIQEYLNRTCDTPDNK